MAARPCGSLIAAIAETLRLARLIIRPGQFIVTFAVVRSTGDHSSPRTIAFFNMRIRWQGLGVLAMAVSCLRSHGLPEEGKTGAPEIEKGDGPDTTIPLGARSFREPPEITANLIARRASPSIRCHRRQ